MNPILSLHTWISLPNELRYKLREIFSIPRSSNTVVNDGVIETDGVTPEDIGHLTVEKMQDYLGETSEDFHKLFDMVVARLNDELEGKVHIPEVTNAKPKTNDKKNK